MSNNEPLAVLLRAVGRFLISTCPRNELTPVQPAIRSAPPILCPACAELAAALGLEDEA